MAKLVILVGLAIALFGAGIWAFRPPAGTGKTIVKFLGFEATLDVPALGVMALGVVLVLVGSTNSVPSPQFKKLICTGQYETNCPGSHHDIFYTCGTFGSDDDIAAKVCQVPSKSLQLVTTGGNMCGYALIEVTCN